MASFSLSTVIAAPIDTVFRLASDFPHAPEHFHGIKRVEVLTPGPVGVGTRFRETRVFMKREATEEMEVTAFDPPHSYTLSCHSCGCLFESTFRFEPDGAGTRATLEFRSTPKTVLARLMMPLGWLMQATMKKCIGQDLSDLKSSAEMATA